MEDQQINNNPIPETLHSSHARAAGFVALALVFFAGASFTWVFMAEHAPRAPVAVAAAAQTKSSLPPPPPPEAFADVQLQAKGAIVVDLSQDDRIFYEKNADAPLALASLTKVPLAIAVAEALPANTIITIPYDTSPYETSQKLRQGERWRLSDVIDFTLAVSSNEGADILANAAEQAIQEKYLGAPAQDAAVWRMNQLVQNLGLTHTYFINPTGLDESATQAGAYGSARDIAQLFAYAADTRPETFTATTKQSFRLQSLDGTESTAINTDEALPEIPGVIMGKTGYTDLAGGNLAVVFEVDGHRIAAVVLGSTQSGRFADMKTLVSTTRRALEGNQ